MNFYFIVFSPFLEQFNDKNGGDSPPEYEKKETEMEKQSSMHRKQKKTIHIPYLK